ncbi:MAG: CoA pyrophosphatase [Vicinamibacterales bacterium]
MNHDSRPLSDLGARLRARFGTALPGVKAQLTMAPHPRVGWDPDHIPAGVRDAAALVLVYPHAGTLHVPLTVRGATLRNHTGQVSLPGGRVDEGESFETAALREAAEEVAIAPAAVHVLGRLTPLHIPVSNFLLHPVVGISDVRPAFARAEWEVARILEVPIGTLLDPATIRRRTRVRERNGERVEIDVPYFDLFGEQVWGATAMVLAEFLALLRD